jgi:hypothetical protein
MDSLAVAHTVSMSAFHRRTDFDQSMKEKSLIPLLADVPGIQYSPCMIQKRTDDCTPTHTSFWQMEWRCLVVARV